MALKLGHPTPSFQDLHTDSPTLVIGDRTLKGTFQHRVGSDLIFTSHSGAPEAGYVGCNTRRLVFEYEQ